MARVARSRMDRIEGAGGVPAKIADWHSRPDLLNEISGRGYAKSQFKSQFQAVGDRSKPIRARRPPAVPRQNGEWLPPGL